MTDEVKEEVKTETSNEVNDNKKFKKKVDVTKHPKYLELKEENEKLNDQLLRLQAEFENFRKRSVEQATKDRKYALEGFLSEMIDMLDIYDKAVNVKTDDEKLKKYLAGFVMIDNKFFEILGNNGVSKIDCLNKPFDPKVAECVETVEKEEVENDIVTDVLTTGYMYKDRVLRYARVKVNKISKENNNDASSNEEEKEEKNN